MSGKHRAREQEEQRSAEVWDAPARVQARGCCRSTDWLSVAPRRLWREIFAWQSSPGQGALQIVFGIAMVARETGTAQTEHGPHLGGQDVHGQQFSSEPEIDDAPVGSGKAIPNMPTLNPALIDTPRGLRGDLGGKIGRRKNGTVAIGRGKRRWLCQPLRRGTQQILRSSGQDGIGMQDFYPGREAGSCAIEKLLIGEARQSSQVTPVGAGQIATVGVSQLLADEGGQGGFQRCGTDTNPSLEVARAGAKQDTRLMTIGAHARDNIGSGAIQVEQNIASIAMLGIRPKIDVKALKVTCAQEAQHGSPCQLASIPETFSGTRLARGTVNQAEEIEIIRHGRGLATNGVESEEECAVGHGYENAIQAPRAYNGFSSNGKNPLKAVSQSRGAPQNVWEALELSRLMLG